MLIFENDPADWKELQSMVGRLFSEMGCDVRIGETVSLVRGQKEIDVLVCDSQTTPASTYLCECKFWRKPVPQEVVHSFRTVLADFGAHRGFIISRAGFQAGAREVVENTNLDLLTFDELQAVFFDRWRIAMGKKYLPLADRLFPYWDPSGGRMPKIKWRSEHIEHLELLKAAYRPLWWIGPVFERAGSVWSLPMVLPKLNEDGDADGTITLATYRQVYDFIEGSKELALRRFQLLYGEIEA